MLGTNRDALQVVLEELKKEKPSALGLLNLAANPDVPKRLLLVPEYREHGVPLIDQRAPAKFQINAEDYQLLEGYGEAVADDRVLLLAHGSLPSRVKDLQRSLMDAETYYDQEGPRTYRNLEVMVGRAMDYFGLRHQGTGPYPGMDEKDIVHFRHMTVDQGHANEIQQRVDRVLFSQSPAGKQRVAEIHEKVVQRELDFPEATRMMEDEGLTGRESYQGELELEYLANHYYLPMVYSTRKRLEYIRHIIDVESEVRFLHALREYIHPKNKDCMLRQLDWWMFSKLDQYVDTVFIPYYDPKQNRIARFIPDFIFWGQKGNRYTVLFVDPKGIENQDWERKAEGYVRVFEEHEIPHVYPLDANEVVVRLKYFARDCNQIPEGCYKRLWEDHAAALFQRGFDFSLRR